MCLAFSNLAFLVPTFADWTICASFGPVIVNLQALGARGRPHHLLCLGLEDGSDEIPTFSKDVERRKMRNGKKESYIIEAQDPLKCCVAFTFVDRFQLFLTFMTVEKLLGWDTNVEELYLRFIEY